MWNSCEIPQNMESSQFLPPEKQNWKLKEVLKTEQDCRQLQTGGRLIWGWKSFLGYSSFFFCHFVSHLCAEFPEIFSRFCCFDVLTARCSLEAIKRRQANRTTVLTFVYIAFFIIRESESVKIFITKGFLNWRCAELSIRAQVIPELSTWGTYKSWQIAAQH